MTERGGELPTQPIVRRTRRSAFVFRKPPRCPHCDGGWLYVEPLALEDGDHEVVCVNCGKRQYLSRLCASEVAKLGK